MKAILLLRRSRSTTVADFRASFELHAAELIAPIRSGVVRYQRNYPDIAAWCSPPDLAEAPYDCVVQIWLSDPAGFDQLKALCASADLRAAHWRNLSATIDPAAMLCFAVIECNSTDEPAEGSVKGMSFHVRRPHLSRDQFRDYYEHEHAPLVSRLFDVPRRYQRNYPIAADACLPAGMADTPFDSVTQAWYDDLETMKRFQAAIADPLVLARIREDEAKFLDGARSILFRVEEVEDGR